MKAYKKEIGLASASLVFTALYLVSASQRVQRNSLLHLLSDGFALPGLLCLLMGGLMAVKGAGALDGLGYLVKTGLCSLFPRRECPQSYRSYQQEETEKKQSDPAPWILIGAGDLAIAAVCLFLYAAI